MSSACQATMRSALAPRANVDRRVSMQRCATSDAVVLPSRRRPATRPANIPRRSNHYRATGQPCTFAAVTAMQADALVRCSAAESAIAVEPSIVTSAASPRQSSPGSNAGQPLKKRRNQALSRYSEANASTGGSTRTPMSNGDTARKPSPLPCVCLRSPRNDAGCIGITR